MIGTRSRVSRAAMVVAVSLSAGAGWAQTPAPTGNAPSVPSPAKVACDNSCVRANSDKAVQACAPRIEAEAPGDYDWLFRPYGRIFQEADLPEKPDSPVVRYRGDSIRFLSPQKEWLRAIYECGYDAADQKVVYVRVRLGVLGKAAAVPANPASTAARRPAAAPAAPMAAPAPATMNLRLVGEPSAVDIRQVPVGTKPATP